MPKASKRNVTEPTPTKKKAKTGPKAKAIPQLLDLHASQHALVDKAVAKREEGLPIIITGKDKETGLGKTRVAGGFLRRCAEKEVATGRRVLIAYAAKTSELAKDQAGAIGSEVSMTPFQLSKVSTLTPEVDGNGMACVSITRTTLGQLFHAQGKDKAIDPKLPAVIKALSVDTVILCMDEVHELYKTDRLPAAVASMRKKLDPVKIEIVGMTATPEFEKKGSRDNAKTLFDSEAEPKPITYSKKQLTALLSDLKQFPAAPKTWETVDLGSPIGDTLCESLLGELKQDLLDFYMAPEDGLTGEDGAMAKLGIRSSIADTLAKIEAQLAAGGDGGTFMDTVRPLVPVKKGGEGECVDAKQSVLIGYLSPKAAAQHMQALETDNAEECNLFELGAGGYGQKKEAMEGMLASFRASEKNTIGMTAKSQHSGHDKFAKLATTIVAIGSKFTDAQLIQLFGRVGRIGTTIDSTDLVPEEYKAFHFKSEWVEDFSGFDDKTGIRGIKLSAQVTDALDSLPNASDLIEINCKKLVRAGEKLGVGDVLALKYIEAERAEMEVDGGEGRAEGEEGKEGEEDGEDESEEAE